MPPANPPPPSSQVRNNDNDDDYAMARGDLDELITELRSEFASFDSFTARKDPASDAAQHFRNALVCHAAPFFARQSLTTLVRLISFAGTTSAMRIWVRCSVACHNSSTAGFVPATGRN